MNNYSAHVGSWVIVFWVAFLPPSSKLPDGQQIASIFGSSILCGDRFSSKTQRAVKNMEFEQILRGTVLQSLPDQTQGERGIAVYG